MSAVAPLIAHALVQAFGESFSQAVGNGFGHDRVVVIMRRTEVVAKFLQANAAGDREGADMILQSGCFRCNEIGE